MRLSIITAATFAAIGSLALPAAAEDGAAGDGQTSLTASTGVQILAHDTWEPAYGTADFLVGMHHDLGLGSQYGWYLNAGGFTGLARDIEGAEVNLGMTFMRDVLRVGTMNRLYLNDESTADCLVLGDLGLRQPVGEHLLLGIDVLMGVSVGDSVGFASGAAAGFELRFGK